MPNRPVPSSRLFVLSCLFASVVWAPALAATEEGAPGAAQRVEELLNQAKEARRTDVRLALEITTRARGLAEEAGLTTLLIESVTSVGILHYSLSEYQQALACYQQSLELAEVFGERALMADALNNIGVLYFVWGEHDSALEYYLRSFAIRLDMGDAMGIGQGYNNLANIYHTAGDYEQALSYYRKSLEHYTADADTGMITGSLNNIGLVHFEQGKYDLSLNTYARALAMETMVDDRGGMATTRNNMGQVYEMRGSLDEALEQYERSLAMRRDLGDRQGISVCLHNIGTVNVKQGHFAAGIDYLQRALVLTEELQVRELTRDNLEALSSAYEEAGDLERALNSYKRYKAVDEELFDEERTRQITMAQTRFAVDLKDREIRSLKREAVIERSRRRLLLIVAGLSVVIILLLLNRYLFQRSAHREIARTNLALCAAHDELEQAARNELAHVARVATMGELAATFAHELNQPLAAIRANARAGANYLEREEPDTAEVRAALSDIGEDAERAQDLITHLRDMMRKGETKRERVDIGRVLRDAVALIRAEMKRLNVDIEVRTAPGLPHVEGDRIQLQQVVLNLIQNGANAMAGTGGDLNVVAERVAANGVRVSVTDAGPPVADGVLADMFDPFFSTKKDGLGMGLPICRTIIEAHGGRIDAERREEGGLRVGFELPARHA